MLFKSIGTIDYKDSITELLNGLQSLIWRPYRFHRTVGCGGCVSQLDSIEHKGCCFLCLIANIVSKTHNVDKGKVNCWEGSSTKKLKLDSKTLRERLPEYLSTLCEECSGENNDTLKTILLEILLFWFGELNDSHKVKSNFRNMFSKNKKYSHTFEWVLYKKCHSKIAVVVIPICTSDNPSLLMNKSYGFVFNEKEKNLSAYIHKDFIKNVCGNPIILSEQMIKNIVFEKMKILGKFKGSDKSQEVLSLVNTEKYYELYCDLKEKYVSYFINIWSDNTDPLFFVYKGVAIATYILLLWEEERSLQNCPDKQSFVDYRCGNGLLVHILINEGHPGKGIDIIKNKMWGSYDSGTILEESPIYPHKLKVEADWIIGIDTDELTPWIPIIAARSTYSTKFILFPCCLYGFCNIIEETGSEYIDLQNYMKYIVNIGEESGFNIEEDKLMIKLNQWNCIVGRSRTSKSEHQAGIDHVVKNILKTRLCSIDLDEECEVDGYSSAITNKDLKDCTEINHYIKEKMFEAIIKKLLSNENVGSVGEEKVTSSGNKWSEWNAGDCVAISELEKLFHPNLRTQHAGSIKSLLEMYPNIFHVCNGMVSIRDLRNPEHLQWIREKLIQRIILATDGRKSVGCWFYTCHPQGCVLMAEECYDVHGMEDASTKQE